MNRQSLVGLGLAVLMGTWTLPALGQNPAAGGGRPLVQPAQPQWYYSLPGFWMLGQEQVRKEIDFTAEQEEKLRKVAEKYQGKTQELTAAFRDPNLKPEDRQKAMQEYQTKWQDLQKDATKDVREVLLPQQIKTLETAELRQRVSGLLQYPQALERLNLNDAQKEQLKKNRDELAAKLHQLNKEAFEDVMKVLSPEQLETLKQPWQAWQPGGQQVARPDPTKDGN